MTPIGGDREEPTRLLDRATEAVISVLPGLFTEAVMARSSGKAGNTNRITRSGGADINADINKYRAGDEADNYAFDTYTQTGAYVGQNRDQQTNFHLEQAGVPWNPDSAEQVRDHYRDGDDQSLSAEEEPVEQPLARNHAISGRVLDQSGMPVAGIAVVAGATRLFDLPNGAPIPPEDRYRQAVTDGMGFYAFQQMAAGEYRIRTLPTADYSQAQIMVRAGVDYADIVLEGKRGVLLAGQVTSTSGEPLVGAVVTPKVLGARAAYTDEYGVYQLQIPLKKDTGFAVVATRDGFRESTTSVRRLDIDSGAVTVNIQLEPASESTLVSGRVTDDQGDAAAGKRVQLYSASRQQNYQGSTGSDGRFAIAGVATGDDYHLRINADRHHHEYVQPDLRVPSDGLKLTIALQAIATGTLSGQMANANGESVPNFSLELRTEETTGGGIPVTADGVGNFFVAAAPSGQLVLETRSYPRFFVSGIDMPPGGEVRAPLVLDWGSNELRGSVVDTTGNPVAISRVVLHWSHSQNGIRSRASRQTSADAQGYFSFRDLGPGPHTVSIDAPGYKSADLHHDISTDGNEVVVELEDRI